MDQDIVNYVRQTRGDSEPQTMTEHILRQPWARIYITGESGDFRECPLCAAIVLRGGISLHGSAHLNAAS